MMVPKNWKLRSQPSICSVCHRSPTYTEPSSKVQTVPTAWEVLVLSYRSLAEPALPSKDSMAELWGKDPQKREAMELLWV